MPIPLGQKKNDQYLHNLMLRKLNIVPRWIILSLDIVLCAIAFVLSYITARDFDLSLITLSDIYLKLIVITGINLVVFVQFKTYRGIVRYTGLQDVIRIGISSSICIAILVLLNQFNFSIGGHLIKFKPLGLFIYALLSAVALITYRVFVKYFFSYLRSSKMNPRYVII